MYGQKNKYHPYKVNYADRERNIMKKLILQGVQIFIEYHLYFILNVIINQKLTAYSEAGSEEPINYDKLFTYTDTRTYKYHSLSLPNSSFIKHLLNYQTKLQSPIFRSPYARRSPPNQCNRSASVLRVPFCGQSRLFIND